jgi:hypothetical protein
MKTSPLPLHFDIATTDQPTGMSYPVVSRDSRRL